MSGSTPTVLITGCSSGIGKGLAQEFARRGFRVFATARRTESLEALQEYGNVEAFSLEMDNEEQIQALHQEVMKRTGGRLDFLINNAGTHYAATGLDLDINEAAHVFRINVLAVMRMCQVFASLLMEAKGKIVMIGSVTRDVPVVWQSAYNASKAALSEYTNTLRVELAPFDVQVIEVVTGFVRSNILHHGLFAPEGSLYLPIKRRVEEYKNQGNANGMTTEEYSKRVVQHVMKSNPAPELWEGKLATYLWVLVTCLPIRLLNRIWSRTYNMNLLRNQVSEKKTE